MFAKASRQFYKFRATLLSSYPREDARKSKGKLEILVALHMPFLIRKVKVKFHRIAALCLSDCQDHITPSVAKAMGSRTITHSGGPGCF